MKKILYVDGEKSIKALLFNLLLPLGGSLLISYFTMGNVKESYKNIIKPEFSPPDFLFGIVWPILYILMGYAAYRVYLKSKRKINIAMVFYYMQLALNFLWPILYFKFNLFGLAFIELIILIIFILLTTISFFKIDKVSGICMIPYLLWCIYASVLNYFIWIFNEA